MVVSPARTKKEARPCSAPQLRGRPAGVRLPLSLGACRPTAWTLAVGEGSHEHFTALSLGRALGSRPRTTVLLLLSEVRAVNKPANRAVPACSPGPLCSGTGSNCCGWANGVTWESPSAPSGPSGAEASSQVSLWPGWERSQSRPLRLASGILQVCTWRPSEGPSQDRPGHPRWRSPGAGPAPLSQPGVMAAPVQLSVSLTCPQPDTGSVYCWNGCQRQTRKCRKMVSQKE